jgi:hypothetical protein
MHAFVIPAGTTVRVVRNHAEWLPGNFREHITRADQLFYAEDVIVDPAGISPHAALPSHTRTIGGAYAERGWYGFQRGHGQPPGSPEAEGDGWTLLVPGSSVTVG